MSSSTITFEQALNTEGGLPQYPLLLNHPTQSSVAIDGWRSALFGLPFLAAGIAIICVAANGDPARKHAPDWLIAMIGSFFVLAGGFLVIHGLAGMAHAAAHRRDAACFSGQPWLSDYGWRREGFAFSAFRSMLQRLAAAMLWTAFLTPFFWVGLNVRSTWPFLVFAGLFGLAGLIFWFRWLQMLADLLRYGNSFLQYDSFPYFLGSSMSARLRIPRHLADIQELTVTLRCVQEKYVISGNGRNRTRKVACYELYKDVATFHGEQLAAFACGAFPLEFPLPEDQPATALATSPPVYWEIEARGKSPGADYEAYFLVPVYKTF